MLTFVKQFLLDVTVGWNSYKKRVKPFEPDPSFRLYALFTDNR